MCNVQADRVSQAVLKQLRGVGWRGAENSYFFLPSVFRYFLFMLLIVLTRHGLIVASCLNPFFGVGEEAGYILNIWQYFTSPGMENTRHLYCV